MFAQRNIVLTRLFSRTRRYGVSRFVHGDRRSTCEGVCRHIRASAVSGVVYGPCEIQNEKAPRFRKRIDFFAVHVASHSPISAIRRAVRYWRTAESYLSAARVQCDQREVNADQTQQWFVQRTRLLPERTLGNGNVRKTLWTAVPRRTAPPVVHTNVLSDDQDALRNIFNFAVKRRRSRLCLV